MKRSILIVFIILSLFLIYSCNKSKKGICECVYITGTGTNTVFEFKADPVDNSCEELPYKIYHDFSRKHYWKDKSPKGIGYTEKEHGDKGLIGWGSKGSVYFINKEGLEKPGSNGYFIELEGEILKLKSGTYNTIEQIQFRGKSITTQ
jgi:hypothetical protein